MLSLAGRVAIVTGASRGIGRGIAERLARDGAKVVVGYGRGTEDARAVVEGIEGSGGVAWAVQADMSSVADIRALFRAVDGRFGRLDILINNAGASLCKPIEAVTEEDFDRLFNLNAKGFFFALQEAARRLPHGGRIVNIGSSSTIFPSPAGSLYAASKAVARSLTNVLAKELGVRGITVNTVLPGPTVPGMFDVAPDLLKAQAIAASPFQRLGTPQDIANLVAFLVSADGAWVSGQHISANGAASV